MAMAASGQRNDLLHRIERILGMEKRNAPDLQKLGGLLAGLLCIIGINALFFFSSPVIQNNSLAFDQFTNPFYHFISDGSEKNMSTTPPQNKAKEIQTQTAKKTNSPVKKKNEPFVEVNIIPKEHLVYTTPEAETGFIQVDERMRLEPRLKKYQEEQVKGTVAATKKILENGQWKEVEKNVADAMTQLEKENLKEKYYNDLKKVNWKKLEEKLRLSYNNINWEKVNLQLNTAITNITLDSIKTVYSVALNSLNHIENWMTENNCSSIPDTDLKLREVTVQKEKVQQQLKLINAIRQRKIIHL
jgi:hypothetical protein